MDNFFRFTCDHEDLLSEKMTLKILEMAGKSKKALALNLSILLKSVFPIRLTSFVTKSKYSFQIKSISLAYIIIIDYFAHAMIVLILLVDYGRLSSEKN